MVLGSYDVVFISPKQLKALEALIYSCLNRLNHLFICLAFIFFFCRSPGTAPCQFENTMGPHHVVLHGPSSNEITISTKIDAHWL